MHYFVATNVLGGYSIWMPYHDDRYLNYYAMEALGFVMSLMWTNKDGHQTLL